MNYYEHFNNNGMPHTGNTQISDMLLQYMNGIAATNMNNVPFLQNNNQIYNNVGVQENRK